MHIQIRLDRESHEKIPFYKQIVDGFVSLIQEGSLPHGTRLPAIRELAGQLEVTRVTVHKAYNALKEEGWVDSTVGKGTFVSHHQSPQPQKIKVSASEMTPDNIMADMNRLREWPGMLSLAMAEPDPGLYPAKEFIRLFRGMEEQADRLFRYGYYQGDPELRQMISGLLIERGMRIVSDDIIMTTGVTQGLSLAIAAICDRGDSVLIEEPTYLGFLNMLKSYGLRPICVPMDEEGPCLDGLEEILKLERPKLFYTIPCFQNPAGTHMSERRRERLLALSHKYHFMILEDDIYGDLRYDIDMIPTLKARAPEQVVYLNSFSKVLLPGLRIGFAVPPAFLKEKMMTMIRCRELGGSPLLQQALTEFLRRGLLHKHLELSLPVYKKRRDVLLDTLEKTMPREVSWSVPGGGFCCWVSLPEDGHFEGLYQDAIQRGVAYAPGQVFFAHSGTHQHLRLCFSVQNEQVIRKAVSILGKLVTDYLNRPTFRKAAFEFKPVV